MYFFCTFIYIVYPCFQACVCLFAVQDNRKPLSGRNSGQDSLATFKGRKKCPGVSTLLIKLFQHTHRGIYKRLYGCRFYMEVTGGFLLAAGRQVRG